MGALARYISQAETLDGFALPTKPDGSFYAYELVHTGSGDRYYDDTTTGLVNHLIPGYRDTAPDEQYYARVLHALTVQVQTQAQINMLFMDKPRTDVEHAILTGVRVGQPMVDEWSCEVPLVLVDAYYMPYSNTPTPLSTFGDYDDPENIIWLRPAGDEWTYLMSLQHLGVIEVNLNRDFT